MRSVRPQTKAELLKYIKAFFGLQVPDVQVCPNHSTPGEFISDMFFETCSKILAVGPRGGYKTLLSAIGDVLNMYFKGDGIVHAGAIEAQAKKAFGYVQKFCKKNYGDQLAKIPTMTQVVFTNGAHIEVHPMTMGKMAGPHEPKLVRDEVDLATVVGYDQSIGVPTSNGSHTIGIVDLSSWYHPNGRVKQLIDGAPTEGRKVHLWCYKEITERCTDDRSGAAPATVYIDRESLTSLTPEQWSALTRSEKENYEPFRVLERCSTCPLVPSCCGDLKRAGGTKRITDVIAAFQDSTAEVWISQHETRKALSGGIVFKREWKPRYHVDESPFVFPMDDFRSWKRGNWGLWHCLDFGRNRPSVGWILHDEVHDIDIHFFELEPFDITIEALKLEIRKIDEMFGLKPEDFNGTLCDPAGKGRTDMDEATRIEKLNSSEYNLKATIPARIGVWNGLDEVKKRLRVEFGRSKFRVVKSNCPVTIQAFESYTRKKHTETGMWLNEVEDPQEFEHPADRIRYYVVGRYYTKRTQWKGR